MFKKQVLSKIDEHLLINYPLLWNYKIHYEVYSILKMLVFLGGIVSVLDLRSYFISYAPYQIDGYYLEISFGALCIILLVRLLPIQRYNFHSFYGKRTTWQQTVDSSSFGIRFIIAILLSCFYTQIIGWKLASNIDRDELLQDTRIIRIANNYADLIAYKDYALILIAKQIEAEINTAKQLSYFIEDSERQEMILQFEQKKIGLIEENLKKSFSLSGKYLGDLEMEFGIKYTDDNFRDVAQLVNNRYFSLKSSMLYFIKKDKILSQSIDSDSNLISPSWKEYLETIKDSLFLAGSKDSIGTNLLDLIKKINKAQMITMEYLDFQDTHFIRKVLRFPLVLNRFQLIFVLFLLFLTLGFTVFDITDNKSVSHCFPIVLIILLMTVLLIFFPQLVLVMMILATIILFFITAIKFRQAQEDYEKEFASFFKRAYFVTYFRITTFLLINSIILLFAFAFCLATLLYGDKIGVSLSLFILTIIVFICNYLALRVKKYIIELSPIGNHPMGD